MDNQEVIRLIRNLPTMCEFTDAYGEPIDSDVYYEAVDIAISALQVQDLQPTCNQLATDTISRKAAIDALVKAIREDPYYDSNKAINGLGVCDVRVVLNDLPSAQPSVKDINVRSSDCISRQAAIDACLELLEARRKWDTAEGRAEMRGIDAVVCAIHDLLSAQPEWNNHTVACLLAELFDDNCACNFNGIDEWLPEKCEVINACPNPVGVACWEQYLKHRPERRTDEQNR